jgi:uncharacterized protein (DUF433 family)
MLVSREGDTMAITTDPLRTQLHQLLETGNAHMSFDDAVKDFPIDAINTFPPNVPYTPWHLIEHVRITQRDILDYIREGEYTEISWPEGHWPARDATADEAAWNTSLQGFRDDLAAYHEIVDTAPDLNVPVRDRDDYPLLRGITTNVAHNAYHVGEFAILRQIMGTWPPGHE